jgi:hypothetical protein
MVSKGVFMGVKVGDENGAGSGDEGDESDDERRRGKGRKSIRSGKIRRDEDEDDWD